MTSPLNHVSDSLAGAWAIMLGRREGLARLDLSIEGFWRSFAAIGLLVPFAALALLSQRTMMQALEAPEAGAPASGGFGVEAIGLLVDWLIFPIVFAALARPLGLADRYVPFIVARNWAAVVLSAMLAPVHAAHILGILPSPLVSALLLAALAITLRFAFVVARTTLATPTGVTLGIVALDFLLALVVWSVVDRIN